MASGKRNEPDLRQKVELLLNPKSQNIPKKQPMTHDHTMISSLEEKENAKATSIHFSDHHEQSKLDMYLTNKAGPIICPD